MSAKLSSAHADWTVLVLTAYLMITMPLLAKRMNPKPVAPAVANGVTYSAEGDGRKQYVVATDSFTGRELWRKKVFRTHIKFWIEEDVQWVFITDLKLMGNSLFVRAEGGRCYSVDIKTHRVHRASCGTVFAQS